MLGSPEFPAIIPARRSLCTVATLTLNALLAMGVVGVESSNGETLPRIVSPYSLIYRRVTIEGRGPWRLSIPARFARYRSQRLWPRGGDRPGGDENGGPAMRGEAAVPEDRPGARVLPGKVAVAGPDVRRHRRRHRADRRAGLDSLRCHPRLGTLIAAGCPGRLRRSVADRDRDAARPRSERA
jgi:hypothetical protein